MKKERYALWATDEITKEMLSTLMQERADIIEHMLTIESTGYELTKSFYKLRGSILILDDVIDTIQDKGKS